METKKDLSILEITESPDEESNSDADSETKEFTLSVDKVGENRRL